MLKLRISLKKQAVIFDPQFVGFSKVRNVSAAVNGPSAILEYCWPSAGDRSSQMNSSVTSVLRRK